MRDGDHHESEFGDYVLLDILGQGGTGVAWRARARRGKHADSLVCLKIMGREFQAATGNRRREAIDSLRHEARVVSQLRHPNIARLLDSGAFNDVWFLAFELVEGATLGEVLTVQPLGDGLAPQHARRIGLEVAAALQCAHEHDVLHRDIKPNNILVGIDGQVKLVDFGLAKANARHAADFTVGVGTPRYRAPEQIREEPLGPATDIYALGLVLYELLATVHPFHDDDPVEFRKNVLRGVPQYDLRKLGVPEDLAAIIEGCLRSDPSQRFQSAAALQTALRSGAKASGFEYDMGEIASAARDVAAESRVVASGASVHEESGHQGETVIANVHSRTTRFETPQELADEVRDAMPGSMSSHMRDQVNDDLSVMARQARDRRHSHTARRRDAATAEATVLDDAPTISRREREATVLEVGEPRTAMDGTPVSLPTPPRRTRKTIRGFSQPGSTELKSDPPPAPAEADSESQPRADTINIAPRKRRGRSTLALAIVGGLAAAVFAIVPTRSTPKRTSRPPTQATVQRSAATAEPSKPEPAMAATPPDPMATSPQPPAETAQPASAPQVSPAPQASVDAAPRRLAKASVASKALDAKGPLVQVTIGLIPYGNVSIDGKRAGSAPVDVKLAPGPHHVVGRNPEFRLERTVVVTPDVHGVVLDLLRDGKPSH